jgi:hypothetical protein
MMIRRFFRVVIVLAAVAAAASSHSAQELVWRKDKTVDASVPGWPLEKVLGRLAAVSGWKIYVEPGLDKPVSVQFRNVSRSEALKLLLGRYNYALVPESKGGAKLYIYETSVGKATALVSPEARKRPKNWIANEIIVALPPGSEEDMEKLAAELGGKIVAKSDALNAYRLQFDDAETAEKARQKLADRDDLETQDNYAYQRPGAGGASSPSPASLFPLDSKPVTAGNQITVALVDTPVQVMEGKMNEFMLPSVHISQAPTSLPADPTHGTSMAQTVLNSLAFAGNQGTADGNLGTVRVLPIDIYGNSPTTTTFEVAQGLYKAIQSEAQVINLSLGGTGESPMVEYLLEMANKKQIMVFASAGNSPTTDPTWPAASPHAIAVTATDSSGNIAAYANRGSFIDIKAPGTSRVYYNGQGYISTGTSTATAYVSGQAAAMAARGFTPMQTAESILKNYDVNRPGIQRESRR